jgi:hypothetical protein
VIGLAPSAIGLSQYLFEARYQFPVYTRPSGATSKALGEFGMTPQTIVLAPSGVVTDVINGAYVREKGELIERRLAVVLPGLRPAPESNPVTAEANTCLMSEGQRVSVGLVVDGRRCEKGGHWTNVSQ